MFVADESSAISPDRRRCSASTRDPSPNVACICFMTASMSESDVAYSPKIHRAALCTFTDFISEKDSRSF